MLWNVLLSVSYSARFCIVVVPGPGLRDAGRKQEVTAKSHASGNRVFCVVNPHLGGAVEAGGRRGLSEFGRSWKRAPFRTVRGGPFLGPLRKRNGSSVPTVAVPWANRCVVAEERRRCCGAVQVRSASQTKKELALPPTEPAHLPRIARGWPPVARHDA